MKSKRLFPILLIVSIIASALCGCNLVVPLIGTSNASQQENTENQITTLGLTPDFDYDRPVVEAHIEIDQLGYLPEQKKMAIFRGENLDNEFRVVSASTGETVFTGEIKAKNVSGTKSAYSYGDFSDLKQEGEYYIQTDVIGYSYKFRIGNDIYKQLMNEAVKQYYYNRCGYSLTYEYAGDNERNACHTENVTLKQDANVVLDVTGGWHMDTVGDRNVIRGCETIEALLFAYEYNTKVFGDDAEIPESGDGIPDILNEIKIETDWLLKMQEQSTGAVFEEVSVVDQGGGKKNPTHIEEIDITSTLYFASSMAYFSYLYQNFDNAYATTCIQAADRAMKYAAKSNEIVDTAEYFRAATMMYRATGYAKYRDIANLYLNNNQELDMDNNVVFSGCVTYLATKQKTVKNHCDNIIKRLKEYAVDLSDTRGDALYLMGVETAEVGHAQLLSEIARLTVVNYMISSSEYEVMMEKYMHFFLGCNPTNSCYVGQYGSINITENSPEQDIIKRPELDGYFILLLSGIEAKYYSSLFL